MPQDAHNEPAAVLLAKIKAEKELLTQEKKIKKSKPLPPIEADSEAAAGANPQRTNGDGDGAASGRCCLKFMWCFGIEAFWLSPKATNGHPKMPAYCCY